MNPYLILVQLKANRCMLSGSLSPAMGNLTSLEVFDVSFNSLTGAVPPSVAALLKLKTFDISFNGFAMSAQALLQVCTQPLTTTPKTPYK